MEHILPLVHTLLGFIAETLGVPGALLIAGAALVVIVVLIFNPQLRALFPKLFDKVDEIRFGSIVVKFRSGVKEAQHQLKRNPELTRVGRTAFTRAAESVPPDLSSRDLVLESWGALKQVIYDSVAAKHIQLTPATQPLDAVDRLLSARLISIAQADHVRLLYDLGKQVVDSSAIPQKLDAAVYRELVYSLLDWLMVNVIPQRDEGVPPSPRRKTEVGDAFAQPSAGRASVMLLGLNGAGAGRAVPVDKEVFRIGADPDNDLVIPDDTYVSGSHAVIRYASGSFWLSDQRSRNGTFVNDVKLKEGPILLNLGDRIRIGNSAFEVSPAAGR